MDSDGSGSLSYSELKRTCKNLKWCGDVKSIFDCLDIEAGTERSLSFKELVFLDSWMPKGLDTEVEPSKPGTPHVSPKSAQMPHTVSGKLQRSSSCPGSPAILPPVGTSDSQFSRSRMTKSAWRPSRRHARAELIATMRSGNGLLQTESDLLRDEADQYRSEASWFHGQ